MSSIDGVVSEFNIGFASIVNTNENPVNLNISEDTDFTSFKGSLELISSTPITPEEEVVMVDGVEFEYSPDGESIIGVTPTQIPLKGPFQDSFLDEDGNWDEEAQYMAYRERELAHKKDVISEWMENGGYDLQNSAALMKALLAKTDNQV